LKPGSNSSLLLFYTSIIRLHTATHHFPFITPTPLNTSHRSAPHLIPHPPATPPKRNETPTKIGIFLVPALLVALFTFLTGIFAATPVDIDGIREPVAGSLFYGNNLISDYGINRLPSLF
jgi:hypothetical protein